MKCRKEQCPSWGGDVNVCPCALDSLDPFERRGASNPSAAAPTPHQPGFTVPTTAGVAVRAVFPLRHLCPYRGEVDDGTVEITWTTRGQTFELHALAAWLAEWATVRISHEDITEDIRGELADHDLITDVEVVTRWSTAGAEVMVARAVPGQRLCGEGP